MRFLKLLHFYILGRRWKIRTGKEDPANPRRNRALHIRVWKRKTERASGQTVFWSSCSQGRNRKNSLVKGLVCLFWWLWVIWHICRTSFTVEWHRNRHSSVGWCHSKHLNPFLIDSSLVSREFSKWHSICFFNCLRCNNPFCHWKYGEICLKF